MDCFTGGRFDWIARFVSGKTFEMLRERREAVEHHFGSWYEDPMYDPFNPQFDSEKSRQLFYDILSMFTGHDFGGYAITWNDIEAVVPLTEKVGHDTVGAQLIAPLLETRKAVTCTKDEKKSKSILSGVSGYIEPNEMVLIQAPPGAGTTTMLNLISGVTNLYESVSGEVLVNGDDIWEEKNRQLYAHSMLRVRQEDAHYPVMTVRETLEFAAKCGIPDFLPFAKVFRRNRVELITRFLGINHTLDTAVGDEALRGVSGGERKRVTIAEMLCGSMGSIVFFDNISKGLDAATTLDIVRGVRQVANAFHLSVFMALQQPGNETFEQFDKICLLDSGKCIYYGPREKVEGYFGELGFERPPVRSMADFLLTVSDPNISESVRKKNFGGKELHTVDEFEEAFKNSELYADIGEKIAQGLRGTAGRHSEADEISKHILGRECLQTKHRQFGILLKRSMRLTWDKSTVISEFASKLLIALLVGTLFFRLPLTQSGAYTRTGVLFMTIIAFALSAVQGVTKKFAGNPIFLKQRAAHFYNAAPFHIAGIVDALVLNVLISLLFSIVLYMLVGLNLNDSGIHFAYFYFMVISLSFNMEMLSRLFTVASPNASVAVILIGVITVVFIIYSGYLISLDDAQRWLFWIGWISPIQYAFRGLAYNEFVGLVFECTPEELVPQNENVPEDDRVCGISTGEAYINDRFGYPEGVSWTTYSLIVLWGLSLVFFLGVIFIAKRMRYRGTTFLSQKAKPQKSDLDGVQVSLTEEETQVGIREAHFTWKDVTYSVPIGRNEKKELLHEVCGYALPGRLCALMGSSGAGKTTLMDVLARRKTKGTITGDVLVNGYPQDSLFGRVSGYVEQMDIHVSKTTVREAIEFSARLRLPEDVTKAEREDQVEKTIDLLELREIQHELVGIPGAAIGLSSEQRKRLTIAVELVVRPSILFLDEPTSGLDSRAALKVANAMRRVSDTGVAVLCTIHQPSKEVFSCFDSLLLLQRGGRVVYFGDLGEQASQMLAYFEKNGAEPMNPKLNPADYMLDQIGAGTTARENQRDWHEIWLLSSENKALMGSLEHAEGGKPTIVPEEAPHIKFDHIFSTSRRVQFMTNLRRFFTVYWRTPEYNFTRFVTGIFQALLLGFSFFQVPNTQAGQLILVSAAFMSALASLMSINSAVGNVIGDRIAFYRESAAGAYSAFSYFIPLLIADAPFTLVTNFVFGIMFFFMVGFQSECEA
uniref:Probable ATP-dependent transporter ycf16 n=1 Tax=Rhodosorus marinus TaxID=101924 RepID=A0A7S3EI01_9RHOD|mmetsp:Transcript_34153/g.133717  ORF Transcript_34153/g.133717 Transcript_34153/m.133717 type:complete len:1219 (+) Transcript_34153:90-3746(+)